MSEVKENILDIMYENLLNKNYDFVLKVFNSLPAEDKINFIRNYLFNDYLFFSTFKNHDVQNYLTFLINLESPEFSYDILYGIMNSLRSLIIVAEDKKEEFSRIISADIYPQLLMLLLDASFINKLKKYVDETGISLKSFFKSYIKFFISVNDINNIDILLALRKWRFPFQSFLNALVLVYKNINLEKVKDILKNLISQWPTYKIASFLLMDPFQPGNEYEQDINVETYLSDDFVEKNIRNPHFRNEQFASFKNRSYLRKMLKRLRKLNV